MTPNISEFSYGYAVTEELIRGYLPPITAAPIFPSLIQEGQHGGGYDVKLQSGGIPLFLQFKLSDFMKRNSAAEVGLNLLTTPFYRMHLRPSRYSAQHQMLLDLENAGNEVYYVAPAFHEPQELNQYYLARTVVQNSAFFRPLAIGPLPDEYDHRVSFRLPEPAWFMSQPQRMHEPLGADRFAQRVGNRVREREMEKESIDFITGVANKMSRIVSEYFGWFGPPESTAGLEFQTRLSPLQRVAYLARTYFDCECMIATIGGSQKK